MTPQEATDLAARTLAAIPPKYGDLGRIEDADRERVASDLAGIERHADLAPLGCLRCDVRGCPDAARYTANLVRTAALYGVTPTQPTTEPRP